MLLVVNGSWSSVTQRSTPDPPLAINSVVQLRRRGQVGKALESIASNETICGGTANNTALLGTKSVREKNG